jgi:hypothetical protein
MGRGTPLGGEGGKKEWEGGRSKRPSGAACALGRLRVIGATVAAAGGGSVRACRLYGATAPPSYRTMVPDIVLLNVCVCEGRVNEFPRESLPKLFSYAVAALSNFFGPPSGTHMSSHWVCSQRLIL